MITGTGAVAGLGNNVPSIIRGIENGRSAVIRMEGWEKYAGLRSLVGAPAELKDEKKIPRKKRRSMGRMSIFAAQAAMEAVEDAGLEKEELISGRTGCVAGSTTGSAGSLAETFEIMLPDNDLSKLTAMKFFHCVAHTVAMNIAQYFGISGVVMATSAACASSLQAIGTGYEIIRSGQQDIMLCGGAEELHPMVTGSFDILYATSSGYNDDPVKTPRPFDSDRDGLVCGEGSGILVLEEYEHAVQRGAKIYAEITGYNTCGNGNHVSQADRPSMIRCLGGALDSAGIRPEEVDFISAHATATIHGDAEETEAIKDVFGAAVPVNSLKGYIGHTLGASGSIELIASLEMMKTGRIFPTMNLESIADDCSGILHVIEPIEKDIKIMVKNCFAFGGINAALVCRKIV